MFFNPNEMNGIQNGRIEPLGLEAYSVEATTPVKPLDGLLFSSAENCCINYLEGHNQPLYQIFSPNDKTYEDEKARSLGNPSRKSSWESAEPKTCFLASRSETFDHYSPYETTANGDLEIDGLNDRLLIRESNIRSVFKLDMTLVPLKIEFEDWNPFRYSKKVSKYCSDSSETRQFLKIRKIMQNNVIRLYFQLESSPGSQAFNEGEMRISLINRRVNPLTFDNSSLNKHNYDDSGDQLIDMTFLTVSEFISVIKFILKDLDKGSPELRFKLKRDFPASSSYDPYLPNRIRSNIREFLKGKTLRGFVPNDFAEKLLPSQIDFMIGLFAQISNYETEKPTRNNSQLSVVKLEDFEKAVKKCVSFYFFALPNGQG